MKRQNEQLTQKIECPTHPRVNWETINTGRAKDMRRSIFWSTIMYWAAARWLKSHGWIEHPDGWLMPDWHPKMTKARKNVTLAAAYGFTPAKTLVLTALGEPYDLHHAINSQRAHGLNRPLDTMLPSARNKATPVPKVPDYIRWVPYRSVLMYVGQICLALAICSWWHPASKLFLLSALALLPFIAFMNMRVRKEWELDWAEEQLNRGFPDEVHRPN